MPTRFWIGGSGLLALVLSALMAQAAEKAPSMRDNQASVAPFAKPPVIDGKFEPGEWDGAIKVIGFQKIFQLCELDAREGHTYIGYTPDALYIAVVTELPPDGKLLTLYDQRDFQSNFDDQLEIWIDPNRGARDAGTSHDRTYIHFMGSNGGAISDLRHDPSKGAPVLGWNGDWQFANGIDEEAKVWVSELSLPFTEMGWEPGTAVGRTIGLLIARNWMRPNVQTTAFPHRGAFAETSGYPTIHLTKDSPSVQVTSLGPTWAEFFEAKADLGLKVFNPGPARKVQVDVLIQSTDVPSQRDSKVLDLPAGGTATYRFATSAFNADAQHTMYVVVKAVDGDEIYFQHSVNWKRAPERAWQLRTATDRNPNQAVRIAWYPSYQVLRTTVDTQHLEKEADVVKAAKITVTDEQDKTVFEGEMSWPEDKHSGVTEFKLPPLPHGFYTVTIALDKYDRETFTRRFRQEKFPFENNTLGITTEVFKPFTPVVVEASTLSVVERQHEVGDLGLWNSVKAQGRELLASPMVLRVNDGQAVEGEGKFTHVADHAAIFEGQAKHPAVTVKTRTTTEYDGCMKVELTLERGGDQPLNQLWLDIPLKDAEAPLFHAVTTKPRVNPAGDTPAGEGVIWTSKNLPNPSWFGNFVPYVWLGSEGPGLAWFADNDFNWELGLDAKGNPVAPCLELIREGGVLTLRVHFIQAPVTLDKPRTIVFGLMASPGKPMTPNWRDIAWNKGAGEGYRLLGWIGAQYWGSDTPYHNRYPRHGDMSILAAMRGNRARAYPKNTGYDGWFERNLAGQPESAHATYRTLNGNAIRTSRQGVDFLSVYWEVFWSTSAGHPETQVFQSEWSGSDRQDLDGVKVLRNQNMPRIGGTGQLVESYRDFAVFSAMQFVHRGIGLYFDNTYPQLGQDPITTNAYRLPNGRVQPSARIWAMRDYFKRIWVLHRQLGPKEAQPYMIVHMTNTLVLPYMVWCDATLDLEWFYGPEPQQSKYPHALMRTESIGRQVGALPLALARIEKTHGQEEKDRAGRTKFGVMAVHEVRTEEGLPKVLTDFGYGQPDCQVFNYWDRPVAVTASDSEAKWVLLKRGQELLLVVCTWNPDPARVSFTIDSGIAGLSPAEVEDVSWEAVRGPVSIANNAVTMDLAGYDVRILKLK